MIALHSQQMLVMLVLMLFFFFFFPVFMWIHLIGHLAKRISVKESGYEF